MSTATVDRATLYPMPSPERRRIVQHLSTVALELDAEAKSRNVFAGQHNAMVRTELERSAGALRLVATLVIQGGMSTRKAKFWAVAATDYLKLVQRADRAGVIL